MPLDVDARACARLFPRVCPAHLNEGHWTWIHARTFARVRHVHVSAGPGMWIHVPVSALSDVRLVHAAVGP